MGGKRYYCDYCDRSLPYSVEARKKHNTGHQHRLVRQAYFNNIKSASEKFNEETSKSKCKRFFSGQNCAFGANCIFSHKTEPELENLKREAIAEYKNNNLPSQVGRDGKEPSYDHIFFFLERNCNPTMKMVTETISNYDKSHQYLNSYYPLPPSLQPPTIEDLITSEYNTWG
ncbi:UNVERIFIED_CONTAM: hypothetical protein RMT77_008332 [Armadillidium vulgare]